jgi:small GTP-binding protein
MRILTDRQETILKDERQILNDLRATLVQFEASPEHQKTLVDSIQQLDELFLLVVVGEFNSGKSAIINALLGQKLLKEGVTPTTTQINLLRYGTEQEQISINEHQQVVTLLADFLAEISIVDTPGTNAIIRAHETITEQFVPRSDLVLFITSADRPFTESERAFMEKIRDWGKKVVLIINKIDILQDPSELEQVESFVQENARLLLGITPEIFPVSARLALKAKQGESQLWELSRFQVLEEYIHKTLDEKHRLRLKLSNPLGVGLHLSTYYLDIINSRLELLQDDLGMLNDVDSHSSVYQDDMYRDFNYRMSDIENVLYEMEQRGQNYFDEIFRLGRIFDLMNKDRIRNDFEVEVVKDVPKQIESKVNELIDWLVNSDLRQWQAVNEHLSERRKVHEDRIVGDTSGDSFHYDREHLMEAVGRKAQNVVDSYDKSAEAEAIARGAQEAVAASAVLEIGAVGLGTLVAIIASTAAADITGVLLASLIAALGIFVIPARRRAAKSEMKEKVAALSEQLVSTLHSQFEREIERSLERINLATAPYTRFVRAEQNKLSKIQTDLDHTRQELIRLKSKIEEI